MNVIYGPWIPKEELFADMFWGITVPGQRAGFWKRQEDESPRLSGPLPVELFVRNTTKQPQTFPATWYKDAEHGGPALVNVVAVSLRWAPFDATLPVRQPFVELKPTRDKHFAPDGKKVTVPPGESFKLAAIDLRDWFKIERAGFYEATLTLDWKALGRHDIVSWELKCSRKFGSTKSRLCQPLPSSTRQCLCSAATITRND